MKIFLGLITLSVITGLAIAGLLNLLEVNYPMGLTAGGVIIVALAVMVREATK